jgi:hypothetical protein
MMMTRSLVALSALLVFAAPARAQQPAPARDRISAEELRGSTATDAYQLVVSLRSMWLTRHEDRLRAPSRPPVHRDAEGYIESVREPHPQASHPDDVESADGLIVVMDGTLLGGRDALREIPIDRIGSVEYLSPEQARLRLSRRARDGAIVVHTLAAGT